jgi:AcrR family transcriptional regulator
MAGRPQGPRDRLLNGAIDHVAANGMADLSLRQLAAALGTSHRMLVYHFGSKEGLLAEVVRAVEARQREALARIAADTDLAPADQARRMWRRLADPALWPHERLFFEIYGQALQGRPHTTALLDGIVESWLTPLTELNIARGMPPGQARASARLGIAVTRGLLLDLLATGDRAGVDEAMELFLAMDERLSHRGVDVVPEVAPVPPELHGGHRVDDPGALPGE